MKTEHQKLLVEIKKSISQTVSDKKIGIAFSGGVDSSLLAHICSDLSYDITLLTIGFANSHDIEFAKKVNQLLKLEHKIYEINPETFELVSKKIHDKIKTNNLSWNENCIAFYYVSKLANHLGIKTVVTANGIDELFCGYNAYREAFEEGETKILELMNSKLSNELEMMNAVNSITTEFNVKAVQPLLSKNFIKFAKTIPLNEKIKSNEDLLRKHMIRNLALEIGVPEIAATKRKKALQYGSKIHKALIKPK